MNNRAQGLPITTVILAILGIVVLVILFAIMTGRLAIFAGAASECPGVCVVSDERLSELGAQGQTQVNVLESQRTRNLECEANIEKRLYGSFIASGIRTDPDNKPIPCQRCCQPLA